MATEGKKNDILPAMAASSDAVDKVLGLGRVRESSISIREVRVI